MNYIKLEEFLEDVEGVIDTTLEVEEMTHIHTDKGSVVMMAADTFDSLMQMLANRKHVYKRLEDSDKTELQE